MAIQDLMNYNLTLKYLDDALNKWGQPCTVYIPKNIVMTGYENELEVTTGVPRTDNQYTKQEHKIWINFKTTKSVFYQFNYFPDEADNMVTAVMLADSTVKEESYIRTATAEQTSIWGNMIFQIKKIQDIGEFKTLKRLYFLLPIVSAELNEVLK